MSSNIYIKRELYDVLRKLGASDEDAYAASEGYMPNENIATKADLVYVKVTLDTYEAKMEATLAKMEVKFLNHMIIGISLLLVGIGIATGVLKS